MSRYWPIVTADVAGSMTYSQLKTTSSAVKGLPSCHTTFFFRRQVTDNPSFATCPFRGVQRPLRLRLCQARRRQHLGGHGRRQAQPYDHLNEAPAAQAAAPHLLERHPQVTLAHSVLPGDRSVS